MRYFSSIRISRHVHSTFIALAFIIILFLSISKNSAAEESTPKVLILDAYHQGEDWSDNEIDGIRIAFNEVYPFFIPCIEHMDTKRFPNPNHLLFVKKYLESKYLGKQFDIIMTLDNSALDLMLKFGDDLFPKVPVVFAGFNGYRPDMLDGHTNITGVAEVQDIEGTLRLALKINPGIKTVLAVHDYTSSGFAVRRDMESVAEKFKGQMTVEYTPEGTVDDLVAQLKKLPQYTIVLLLTYVTDKNGRTLTREESTRLITSSSSVPVYAMHETRLGYGIVGGVLLEGREHGRQAAAQALRILAGEDISQISVENSRSRPVFDLNVLDRFNISEKRLPTGSVIINRPVSFWRQHQTIWVPAIAIIGVLVISTILLSRTVIKMNAAEKSLRDVIQLNKGIIDSAQEGVVVYDLDLRYRVWNPFMEKLSGVSAKNVLGLHPLEVFPFHKETQLMKVLERALAGETPEPIDFPFSLPDSGLSGWTSDQSSPLRDANGDIIGVIATVRDITNRKKAEENLRRNERLLQNIIDSSADYIYVKDSCLRTVLCNRTFAHAVGKNPQDMVGKTDIENGWLPEFVIGNPEKEIKGFEKDDKDALSGKTVRTIDEPGNVKQKVHTFDTIKMPLRDENGSIIGMFGISRDITERQQAEKELRKQKNFLQKAQEIGKIGTWELDIQKNELLWTDESYRIFGLPIGTKLTYEIFLNCVHPEDRKYVDTEWKASFDGKPYDIEHRLLVDGKIKWVREKAELEFNSKGECIRGTGFTQDITERKFSDFALRDFTERFKKIFDSQLDAIFVLSTQTPAVILECNQAAINIFGYTSDELISKAVRNLHIDDSHIKAFQDRLYSSIKENGYLKNFEFSMKRKDGTIFPSEHTVLEMKNDSGDRTGWISIVRDLSEIQKTKSALIDSEDKFRILFENAPLSYQSLDENGNFIEVNQTWLNVLGYKKEEVLGKNFGDFLHPDWQEHFKTNFPRFKAIGEILGVEFEMLKKDGTFILVSFHGKIGHKPDGTFKQTHCVFRDITEQKRMEDEKIVLEAKLQQAQKMEAIGTLAGGIAHDFNNILFPIVGYTEMLLEDLPENSPLRENVKEVYTGALRAKDLVKQILAFSRQDSGEIKLIKIQPVVKEALKLIRSIIPTSIEIKQSISSRCGFIKADPTKIHQIVMNLATNAYHAMENTGGQLSVSLREIEKNEPNIIHPHMVPGPYACLSIADTGIGMDIDIQKKIFDPFFTTKEPGKGTGMGLSAVHGIVRDIGGTIYVYSEPGKGSEFQVYLPIVKSSVILQQSSTKESIQGGTERILLVDDEDAIVKMERKILNRLGYQVVSYTNSLDALETFRTGPDNFDIIITDMAMPKMSGDKLSAELIKINPCIPILLCTGFSEKLPEEQMKAFGIKGILMKPVTQSDLAKTIRKVLDQMK